MRAWRGVSLCVLQLILSSAFAFPRGLLGKTTVERRVPRARALSPSEDASQMQWFTAGHAAARQAQVLPPVQNGTAVTTLAPTLLGGGWTCTNEGNCQAATEGPDLSCLPSNNPTAPALCTAGWDTAHGVNDGDHFWQFHFSEAPVGGVFVGLSNQEFLAPGYNLKCLCYGGNLSNGSELLVSDFGPLIQNSTTVGMLVSFKNNKLNVYFDVNGESLGRAYQIDADSLPDAFPVVQVSPITRLSIEKLTTIPDHRQRYIPEPPQAPLGDWTLLRLTDESGTVTIPEGLPSDPELKISNDTDTNGYQIMLKVVNSYQFSAWQDSGTGSWMTSQAIGTLIAPPPDQQKFESDLLETVNGASELLVTDETLTFNGRNGMTAYWQRDRRVPDPYRGNPFDANTVVTTVTPLTPANVSIVV